MTLTADNQARPSLVEPSECRLCGSVGPCGCARRERVGDVLCIVFVLALWMAAVGVLVIAWAARSSG